MFKKNFHELFWAMNLLGPLKTWDKAGAQYEKLHLTTGFDDILVTLPFVYNLIMI